jgi:signal-transduction protein with cAMP-binding, CBS, and nucleotidyltransferase domain
MGDDRTVRDVMTKNPVMMPADATLVEAAQAMRDRDIGDVIVLKSNSDREACGIVTDRDIVVRGIAGEHEPSDTTLDSICRHQLISVAPTDPVKKAVDLMMQRSVRRIAVVEGDQPVGIVSMGDLATERDPKSALGQVSQAPPNN